MYFNLNKNGEFQISPAIFENNLEKTKEKNKKEERKFRKKVLDSVVLYCREQWPFWRWIGLQNHKICAGETTPQVTKGKNRKKLSLQSNKTIR